MRKEITHTFFFPHPPKLVWEYLTKADLMAQWLMPNDFLPIIGHAFQFRIALLPQYDFDGIVYCTVLEIVPLKKLSYSWKCGPGNGIIEMDSVVAWKLHPKDNGTELLLEHTGFKETDLTLYTVIKGGWLQNIKKIDDLINKATHDKTNT
jgi:uncharacterized protein YndB with AHSA1/START domain